MYRSATFVDAACCYKPSSLVRQSVTVVSPAKTAQPIEMLFGMLSHVDPGNHVLDRGADVVTGRGNFRGVYGPLQNVGCWCWVKG